MSKKKKLDILDLHSAVNIVELLEEDQLTQLGELVVHEYDLDKESCKEWEDTNQEAMDIAQQVVDIKDTPWENAANIKFPLMTTAAIQYAARTYPEIIRNSKVVNVQVLGTDPDGSKEQRAKRISEHMSAQLLVEDPEWEAGTDKLLHSLAIVGLVFKKTYWNELEKRNCSDMIAPADLVVNKDIKSIETARRITHKICMYKNDIVSAVRFGIYDDKILEDLMGKDNLNQRNPNKTPELSSEYKDEVHDVLEQHRYLDLDRDGYEEPYVVTVHKDSRKVLRIYRCFDLKDIKENDKGQIWKIDRIQYFTDFHFIPNPDGSFHSIGLGQLLLPINEAINTLCNQLLDAGTLSNQQNGFLARTFKTKSGSLRLSPGEFVKLDISADDLHNSILPMPVRDPSSTLFQMLGLLIQTGKELSSVSDILQGQQPAQNVPATTVLALIEQGLKVFSAIQKRLYRSLKKEFQKLYRLNGIYLDETQEYRQVLATDIITREDYSDKNLDVIPVSDPSMSSDAQRLARARAMMEMIPMLPPNGQAEVMRNWLEALQTPENQILKILPDPNDPSSPQAQQQQQAAQQAQVEQARVMMEQQLKAEEIHIKDMQSQSQAKLNEALADESAARIKKMFMDAVLAEEALKLNNEQAHIDMSIKAVKKLDDMADQEAKAQAAENE